MFYKRYGYLDGNTIILNRSGVEENAGTDVN